MDTVPTPPESTKTSLRQRLRARANDRWPQLADLTIRHHGGFAYVDSDTTVDVNTGMIAAARLQALIESRAGGTRIADLMAKMGRIIDAIHSTVPEELWPEILRKIDGPVAADSPMDEFEDGDDAEEVYDPWNCGGRQGLLDCDRAKRPTSGRPPRPHSDH